MSALSIATRGYGFGQLGIATRGYLIDSIVPVPPVPYEPKSMGSAVWPRELEVNVKHQEILREDEESVLIIQAFLKIC